jgi:uncharacterized protein (TIGR02145 family)/uncharacterized repeat protein (TIGR02543 family)
MIIKKVGRICLSIAMFGTGIFYCVSPNAGGTGTGNGVVVGKLYQSAGKEPARGASVVMRSRDYLPKIQLGKRMANDNVFACSTSTDSEGVYRFTKADSIRKGLYCIEGRDSKNNCVLIDSVVIDLLSIDTLSDTLKSPATIQGKIQRPDSSAIAYVRVFGLDIYAKVNADNTYALKNLPQGNLRLQLFIAQEYDTLEVVVKEGIDTVGSPLYSMTYDGNENTGGTVPVVDGQQYRAGEKTTIRGNTGNLVKPDFTFFGWNTEKTGNGRRYLPGDTIVIKSENVTLFAQWRATEVVTEPNSITYDGNGNDDGTVPVDSNRYMAGATVTILGNIGKLVKMNLTFGGWSIEKAGNGAVYVPGDKLVMKAEKVTLFALWKVGGAVTDIDGNSYTTVTIGNQTWMAENLKTTRYNDGTPIPLVEDTTAWRGLTTPGYCWYGNAIANKSVYGALYNGYAVGTGKLAPVGWHVASKAEWDTLLAFLGGASFAGGKLKESGTVHWNSPNSGATNESGFSALPGGYRSAVYGDGNMGMLGEWWPSTEYGISDAWFIVLMSNAEYVYGNASTNNKNEGRSVRCVRTGGPVAIDTVGSLSLTKYTVTFDSRGGRAVATQTLKEGSHAAEPGAPTRGDYTFAGWFKDSACTKEWVFSTETVIAPVTLYAKWVVMDNDGNIYTTVTIGSREWLVENLKTKLFNDSTPIPLVEDNSAWNSLTTPGYCWYNNDTANKKAYGALYNWHAVNTGKLAPWGWHVATHDDWDTLMAYPGGKNILGGGRFTNYGNTTDGAFGNIGIFGEWWASTEYDASAAWFLILGPSSHNGEFNARINNKSDGLSVRCVRD